jgi:hypothetical protein
LRQRISFITNAAHDFNESLRHVVAIVTCLGRVLEPDDDGRWVLED